MRKILSAVWRGERAPEKARELIRLQLQTRASPFTVEEEESLLGVLELLFEKKFKSVNDAEKEIEWILGLKSDQKKLCQT